MKRIHRNPVFYIGLIAVGSVLVTGITTGNVALVGVLAMGLVLFSNRWPLGSAEQSKCASRSVALNSSSQPTPGAQPSPVTVAKEPMLPANDPHALIDQMLQQGRYCLLLRQQLVGNLTPAQYEVASRQQQQEMALVPSGAVVLNPSAAEQPSNASDRDEKLAMAQVPVEPVFLDRYLVTNRQYQHFVDAQGYRDMGLWFEEAWAAMLSFVDQTGQLGPAGWSEGHFPNAMDDHPVVGVSWYEAMAYTRWVGKRLPSDPEWVKAGVWPVPTANGLPQQRKYPWGNSFQQTCAHSWQSGSTTTVSVEAYPAGASPGGVNQLVGNVWEWMHDDFGAWLPGAQRAHPEQALKSIRGGAFDTYFESQLNCQFASGENPLSRRGNIGFRCALGACDLAPPPTREEDGLVAAGNLREDTTFEN